MNGYRTLLLNIVAFVGMWITSSQFDYPLDPTWVAAIVAGLNILKRYLAPTNAPVT